MFTPKQAFYFSLPKTCRRLQIEEILLSGDGKSS